MIFFFIGFSSSAHNYRQNFVPNPKKKKPLSGEVAVINRLGAREINKETGDTAVGKRD